MAQMTPFELFGLKPAFKVDLEALHAAHERAILQVHPDRFADRPAAERRVAEQWASRINEAYAVLKDPVKRAVWLCKLLNNLHKHFYENHFFLNLIGLFLFD